MEAKTSTRDVKRAGRFGLVGIFNTLLDFFLFNALTKFFGFGLIPANAVSTTVAMVMSFTLNKRLVFKSDSGSLLIQALTFFATTAVGLYVIQNGIIHFLTDVWTAPLWIGVEIVRGLGIPFFSDAFYINNGAKAIATVASLAWNYLLYRSLVFRPQATV